MPKFNEKERDIIRERLFEEGEKLFCTHGVRKVTINDLTDATAISHGAFYSFFKNKEHLFMEINLRKQREIFNQVDDLIDKNKNLKSQVLVKCILCFLMDKFFADPIISSIHGDLWEYLSRRLPQETIRNNSVNDATVIEKLMKVGVKFKFPTSLVVKTVQCVFMGVSSAISDEEGEAVINILVDGVIEKVVEE